LQVWKFYHDKRQQAQSGCQAELESQGQEGSNCVALDNLERLVYEVAFSGDAEQLYHVLRVRCRPPHPCCRGAPCPHFPRLTRLPLNGVAHGPAQRNSLSHLLQTQSNMAKRAAAGSPEPASKQEVLDGLKDKALQLFDHIDSDGNGVIDRCVVMALCWAQWPILQTRTSAALWPRNQCLVQNAFLQRKGPSSSLRHPACAAAWLPHITGCVVLLSVCYAALIVCLPCGVCAHREEFLCAMKLLQHALGDSEMELVFSCMDSHGYITPEQVRARSCARYRAGVCVMANAFGVCVMANAFGV
jgi:hypothetical protein